MLILIVEDEVKTAAFIKKGLSEYGILSDVAYDGEEGLQRALTGKYDFLILDILLPNRDGWSIISELRRRRIDVPVIMLTALDAVPSRVRGLESGVDDYMVKPFAFSELYARIQTISRRGPTLKQEVLRVADLELDLEGRRATRAGKRLDLTPKEFALLTLLVRRSGEVIPRTRIVERIWDMDVDSNANILDVHMRRLRAKVDDPFEVKLIHTVRGVGYVLEERQE
ncbi:heavy metal response regulator transcription factor [Geomesophilobacter sediminis]|uniref:Heavy metal response regulator transcription factor n=1 Tax=Geomesophilobacter sediminis TaxID=2798584 RepID=A0A8J7M2M4_9BACT|nr:heavy metal response regulator transcription factor [Geomesophilobacter sediminis]MBJ6727276.1 heavy metal response regulator transcription factor [Geomesophilobacter sediminis]